MSYLPDDQIEEDGPGAAPSVGLRPRSQSSDPRLRSEPDRRDSRPSSEPGARRPGLGFQGVSRSGRVEPRRAAPPAPTGILVICIVACGALAAGYLIGTHQITFAPPVPVVQTPPPVPVHKKEHISSTGGLFSSLNINDNLSPDAKRIARLSILGDQIASTQAEIDRLNDELTNGGQEPGAASGTARFEPDGAPALRPGKWLRRTHRSTAEIR